MSSTLEDDGGEGKDGGRKVVDRHVCDACGATGPPTQCARCHSVSYCDVKCQTRGSDSIGRAAG